MKKCFYSSCFILFFGSVTGQSTQEMINKLPDFIPPTPEVSSLIKADNLTVGYSTGSPNINITIFNFQAGSYRLPITLNYSSTGLKVDEYASMVGMGWSLNYGGVISRTVMDKPDENRNTSNCNLNSIDAGTLNQTLYNFLTYAPDKESDIFTFSFSGYSGKFIIGLTNNTPIQLTKNNLRMVAISNDFRNGFIITTDNGTDYYFQDIETSKNRDPQGSNCDKTYDYSHVKTSWYLTKIVLPNTRRQINFTYTTADVAFENSITQTISKVTYSESFPCGGFVCTVGTERFSTCISRQTVESKFISKIESTEGDKVEFTYDATARTDLNGGKRLKEVKVTNRNGIVISKITLSHTYKTAISGSGYESKRMFLDSLSITGSGSATSPLMYKFQYIDYGNLPPRLSYAQDWYGYYNGKTSNPSLLPVLNNTDVNYSTFENGGGATLVNFGDRSIDTTYSNKGLLNKISYPSGGYDTIVYVSNRISKSGNEVLAGGHSVSIIKSYTDNNTLALQKEFIYRNKDDNSLSSFLLNGNLRFSQLNTSRNSGFSYCGGGYCDAPSCSYAVVTSNAINPIAAFGSQHIYFKTVLEKTTSAGGDNGMTEHQYSYFNGGNLDPYHRRGNYILNAPFQIVPDILIGEQLTKMYKKENGSYSLVKSIERKYRLDSLTNYINYTIKKNYDYACSYSPPHTSEFEPYDIEEIYINKYTVELDTTIEKDYMSDNQVITRTTVMNYDGPYTYPTRVKTTGSNGLEEKTEYKYPQDYANLGYMLNRNIVSPVIEENQYRNASLVITKNNSYGNWYSDEKIVVPDTTEIKLYNNSNVQRIVYYAYDTLGNVVEAAKEKDQRISFIWDYKNNFPIAKVQNTNNGVISYTSFEADGSGNWTISSALRITPAAVTGTNSYNLTNGSISKSGLSSSATYIVSYWTKNPAAFSITGTISSASQGRNFNGWAYFEHRITGQTQITISGNGLIDELRLYPEKSLMTTFTYEPLMGVTSQCDASNRITYFEYDAMARLNIIRDQDRFVVKKICYTNSGQQEDCTVTIPPVSLQSNNIAPGWGYTAVYTNTVTSQQYSFSISASAGTQPLGVIPAGTYNLTISKTGTAPYLIFGAGCNGMTIGGTSATFYNIEVSAENCNTIMIDGM